MKLTQNQPAFNVQIITSIFCKYVNGLKSISYHQKNNFLESSY